MGLHLNYELRLPGATSSAEVTRVLRDLHQRATALPFAEVTPVYESIDGAVPGEWYRGLGVWARVIATPTDEDDPPHFGDIATARGFVVYAGRGCEPAFFAFLHRVTGDGEKAEWFWHCCCKTQYASAVNDAHFIACHTSLAALLDHAIALGIDVVVRDEGHYWETRDTARLLAEVQYMNRLVARLAGLISDSLPPGLAAGAPILEHPDFERLEVERNPRPRES